ncbi:MAG: MBL fold metallo-hydrolase RNA specificity domain-containing protein, partial [Planctomycetia bacterium]|nr:MBL fold metallo-hydrolase RNA specificity domain-containing protein [Planctomycetia bacterium]
AGTAELPRADVLIMESTFGDPRYRLPPRDTVIRQLCDMIQNTLESGRIPVIRAYALGKAQEVTRILSDAGFAVDQSPEVAEITDIYEKCGVHVGRRHVVPPDEIPALDAVLIVPPRHDICSFINRPETFRIAVTGWAIHPETAAKLHVDAAVPLTDHADYDELFAAVERVQPSGIYCVHGPFAFADRLREAGWNAHTMDTDHRQNAGPGSPRT